MDLHVTQHVSYISMRILEGTRECCDTVTQHGETWPSGKHDINTKYAVRRNKNKSKHEYVSLLLFEIYKTIIFKFEIFCHNY